MGVRSGPVTGGSQPLLTRPWIKGSTTGRTFSVSEALCVAAYAKNSSWLCV